MKYRIKVYSICQDQNNIQRKKYNFYLEIITCDSMIYTMNHPGKFIVSGIYNQATTKLAFHSNEKSKDKLSII